MRRRKVTLNDLPLHSQWPSRILGYEKFVPKRKSYSELQREYENEKWKPLLQTLNTSGKIPTLRNTDKLYWGENVRTICFDSGNFRDLLLYSALQRYVEVIQNIIQRHFASSTAFMDLGCGYGAVTINLIKSGIIHKKPVFAADFCKSALDLISRISSAENVDIVTGMCDFYSDSLVDFEFPAGATILTSYATTCVPQLKNSFFEKLISFKPKCVVHFESCYEHCNCNTIHGLLRKKYIDLNDYNTNLLSTLKRLEKEKRIKILSEKESVFGLNPLSCLSEVVWSPV